MAGGCLLITLLVVLRGVGIRGSAAPPPPVSTAAADAGPAVIGPDHEPVRGEGLRIASPTPERPGADDRRRVLDVGERQRDVGASRPPARLVPQRRPGLATRALHRAGRREAGRDAGDFAPSDDGGYYPPERRDDDPYAEADREHPDEGFRIDPDFGTLRWGEAGPRAEARLPRPTPVEASAGLPAWDAEPGELEEGVWIDPDFGTLRWR